MGEHRVKEGDKLLVLEKEEEKMQEDLSNAPFTVCCKTLTGKQMELTVAPSSTLAALKHDIREKWDHHLADFNPLRLVVLAKNFNFVIGTVESQSLASRPTQSSFAFSQSRTGSSHPLT